MMCSACMGKTRNPYILVRKPKGKRPFKRPRHRWKDEIGSYGNRVKVVGWIHLAQYRDQK